MKRRRRSTSLTTHSKRSTTDCANWDCRSAASTRCSKRNQSSPNEKHTGAVSFHARRISRRRALVRYQVSVIFTGGGLARLPGCDRWKIGVAFDGLFAHMFAAVEQKYRESDS